MTQGDARYCLRYPPSIKLDNPSKDKYESFYPIVEDNYRCGEGEVEA